MRAYETSCDASTRACSCPVSCVGKSPFGMTTYKSAVRASVITATTSVAPWWRSTHCSQRS